MTKLGAKVAKRQMGNQILWKNAIRNDCRLKRFHQCWVHKRFAVVPIDVFRCSPPHVFPIVVTPWILEVPIVVTLERLEENSPRHISPHSSYPRDKRREILIVVTRDSRSPHRSYPRDMRRDVPRDLRREVPIVYPRDMRSPHSSYPEI